MRIWISNASGIVGFMSIRHLREAFQLNNLETLTTGVTGGPTAPAISEQSPEQIACEAMSMA